MWVIVQAGLILVGIVLAGCLLYLLRTLLLLLIIAVFFCYLIAPLVRFFEQPVYVGNRELKLPRGAAIGVVYVLIAGTLFLVNWFIWPLLWEQITTVAKDLPGYVTSASNYVDSRMNDANSWLRHLRLPRDWRNQMLDHAKGMAESFRGTLLGVVSSMVSYLSYLPWLVLIPVLSFFMLKDAAEFEQQLVSFLPTERLKKRVHWLLLDMSRTLAAYIRAQLTACLVIWLLVTLGLVLISVPYGAGLGALAGVLEFVPLLGPLISAVVIFSVALTKSWTTALICALFLAILRIAQDYVIYPRIVGREIKIHPLVVVLAILAGAELAGVPGIFLAVPVVGMTIVGYNHYLAYKGIQRLDELRDGGAELVAARDAALGEGPSSHVLQE